MKVNEIKKTIEQVVRVEYIAEDGTVFYSEEECKKYEESALFAVSSKLKRFKVTNQYELLERCEDEDVEIFDIQTEEDLENLKRYLYIICSKNGAKGTYLEGLFKSVDGYREKYVFENITIGHEVILFWSYDKDCFWTYGDGSIQGYLDYIKDKWTKLITPKEETENATH